ncbi:aldo/keto reductase [Aspergillus novofumigatus IBT 16806]|uniref:Aldo/keto reductase n=1 Tax=Aspergillus novofumigatus (strain IBT 16806) TaxID=1392255 RepID=A0A2I1BSQ9_ASPN1|nr:Aldo/keto reductase [Aspergillus novofumigatus IBT 16806]PKX88423.1 Aldo/keto reductase [Aspergillus novofumigatus IBT 16806]
MAMEAAIPFHYQKNVNETICTYRQLGKSGLKVSVPILGCMGFGRKDWVWDWVLEEEESMKMLKAAWDRGINTWDTANIFSNGDSEKIIGKALRKYEIPRHKVVIITKVFCTVGEHADNAMAYAGPLRGTKEYVNQSGLSRQSIFRNVQASLDRLQTDYIDVLMIHRCDDRVPYEETMEALNDLVRAGKVRYLGASSMWTYQFVQMQVCAERHGWTKFICMENHYSLLYREEEREMNKFCDQTGVGIIPWAPLCRGFLARRLQDSLSGTTGRAQDELVNGSRYIGVREDPDHKIIRRVEELANRKGWMMVDVALAWLNKRVTSPVVGMRLENMLDEVAAACKKTLTTEEEKYLEELYQPRAISGHA